MPRKPPRTVGEYLAMPRRLTAEQIAMQSDEVGEAVGKPKVETHYDVIEIASAWGMSTDLVRSLFRNEPGVLTIERPATRSKRSYSTIRVPESVMQRVHTRLSASRIS